MRNNTNYGYFNISGNTFIEARTNKSVIVFSGNFLSLIFTNNSFYNVSSVYEGGVFKFDKYIYYFLFRQFGLAILFQVLYFHFVVLLIVLQVHEVFYFNTIINKHNKLKKNNKLKLKRRSNLY
jgi:hypothetical protein